MDIANVLKKISLNPLINSIELFLPDLNAFRFLQSQYTLNVNKILKRHLQNIFLNYQMIDRRFVSDVHVVLQENFIHQYVAVIVRTRENSFVFVNHWQQVLELFFGLELILIGISVQAII